jgi:phosphatidate cytidylyltransferase
MTDGRTSKWSDLAVRSASAIVLIPAVVACVWFGGYWFLAFTIVLGCLIAHEWTSIVHPRNRAQYAFHMAAAIIGAVLTAFVDTPLAASAVLGLALLSILFVRFGDRPKSFWSYLGIFYVGLPVIAFTLLRQDPVYGSAAILWILLIVWGADILAYFAGRTIGGPKLAPRISPKKTWAGLAGAIVGSTSASMVFAYFLKFESWAMLAVLAAGLAVAEQGGDLFESSLKRHYGVKDSGRLIPGHGGVIDRVDGLITVAVLAAIIGLAHGTGPGPAQGLLLW